MGSTRTRLNILWLSHFVPYPPKGGSLQRSYYLIARVAQQHDVHLVALRHKSSTHPVEEADKALRRFCRSVRIVDISRTTEASRLPLLGLKALCTMTPFNVLVYRSADVRRAIAEVRSTVRVDLAHVDTIGLAQYLSGLGDTPAVMNHHGAESYMIRRRIAREQNPLRRAFFFFEWLTLRRYERLMCPRVAENIVVSDYDGQLMAESAPNAIYTAVDNGVDTRDFTPVHPRGHRAIVFAGRLDQYSNRYGMTHFAEHIWPIVKRNYPDATIDVIGSNPPAALQALGRQDPGFRVHGFVDDLLPFLENATVSICPVYDGGGTRLKVLTALGQGMPLVSTTVGCEGIDVIPETHVLIGDTPEVFAAQVGRLFDDPALRQRLATNGRRLIEERYSWDTLAERLLAVYDRVASSRGSSAAGTGSRAYNRS